jgi:hypothetical protein
VFGESTSFELMITEQILKQNFPSFVITGDLNKLPGKLKEAIITTIPVQRQHVPRRL